jgi:hypothetical protein
MKLPAIPKAKRKTKLNRTANPSTLSYFVLFTGSRGTTFWQDQKGELV